MHQPGERYGHIVIVRLLRRDAKSHAYYEVLCDCGSVAVKKDSHLHKKTKFCSKTCKLHLQRFDDLEPGQRFAAWTVLERGYQRVRTKVAIGYAYAIAARKEQSQEGH